MILAFGLRRGEALGLHWAGVDFDAATLQVTHTVSGFRIRPRNERMTRLLVASEGKTRGSRRTLFLTPELVVLRRRHKAHQAEERISAGAA